MKEPQFMMHMKFQKNIRLMLIMCVYFCQAYQVFTIYILLIFKMEMNPQKRNSSTQMNKVVGNFKDILICSIGIDSLQRQLEGMKKEPNRILSNPKSTNKAMNLHKGIAISCSNKQTNSLKSIHNCNLSFLKMESSVIPTCQCFIKWPKILRSKSKGKNLMKKNLNNVPSNPTLFHPWPQ